MWVTFEHGFGIYSALERQVIQFGSYRLKLERAVNPTDIIFENVGVNQNKHLRRKDLMRCLVLAILVLFLAVGMMLVAQMQVYTYMNKMPMTDCDTLSSAYTDEELHSIAYTEYRALERTVAENGL